MTLRPLPALVVLLAAAGLCTAPCLAQPSQTPPSPANPSPESPKPNEPDAEPVADADSSTTPSDAAGEEESVVEEAPAPQPVSPSVLGFTLTDIRGQQVPLSSYKGSVLLLVNVASECGFTGQYAGLQKLHEQFASRGLVVIGIPSDDFGGQEPGSNEEILAFCTSKYNVTFPMMSKVHVTGPDAIPLYVALAAQPAPLGGEPRWNFTKFLVNRAGDVVARYESRVRPDDTDLVTRLNQLLDEQAPATGTSPAAPASPSSGG